MEATRRDGTEQRGALALALACIALLGFAACEVVSRERPPERVRPGVDVLMTDSLHLVAGRRVGLVTNQTGVDAAGRSSIDRLHESPDVELVALFSPEHGIRGTEDREVVEGGTDERTGLPIHSLYGETRRPTPEMLRDVEVLVFDIQDLGVRYYTYVSTMALAMEAAGERDLPFVVLDRPNPLGGELVQGNVLEPEHASFTGMFPVPMRHGMTAGELARLYVGAFGVEVSLHVVPAAGWSRERWADQTGLPWVRPSPSMPSLESATHYPGTCLFEGTNLSVGRGTVRAFQQVGAPWLDGEALAERLNARGLSGARFEPVEFVPEAPPDGKYGGERVRGVRLVLTDRDRYDPTVAGVTLLLEARRLAGERWEWRPSHFDRLAGTERLRHAVEEGRSLEEIVTAWEPELEAFRALRRPYLIY